MQIAKLHQVAAFARDLDEAVTFYRDTLGAKHIATCDPPGLAFFSLLGVRLLLEKAVSKATLYFWVDDIDASHQELLARGVPFEQEPHLIHRDADGTFGPVGSEEWMAFFRDPSGNLLALTTRKQRHPPPSSHASLSG